MYNNIYFAEEDGVYRFDGSFEVIVLKCNALYNVYKIYCTFISTF